MSFSVNTNASSLSALQVLQNTQNQLQKSQSAINTGLRIATAKDNAAVYSIAQNIRANIGSYNAVLNSIDKGISTADIALAAGGMISDLLIELKEKAVLFNSTSSTQERTAILTDYNKLLEQITTVVDNAEFNGANLLKGPSITFATLVYNLKSVAVGSTTNTIDTADLNGDGNLDIVVNGGSDIKTFSNDGSGNFSLSDADTTSITAYGVKIADTDNDGTQDLVSYGAGGVETLSGDGAGNFAAPVSVTAAMTMDVEYTDTDGDGNLEPTTSQNFSTDFMDNEYFDIDNDGDVDHLRTIDDDFAGTGEIRLGINDGTGSFSYSKVDDTLDDKPLDITVADINNDGFKDFTVLNSNSNSISVYLNDGVGGFVETSTLATGIADINTSRLEKRVIIKDLNNDGKVDLALSAGSDNNIELYTGDTSGTFTWGGTINIGVNTSEIVSGDFNNDGFQDIAIGNDTNNLYILETEYNVVNSVIPSKYSVITSPDSINNIEIDKQFMTLVALGLHDISLSADPVGTLNQIDIAIADVSLKLARLGSFAKTLETLRVLSGATQDELEVGLGNLVDADMARESANLQALQVKEQLGVQSLSLANGSSDLILNLFNL